LETFRSTKRVLIATACLDGRVDMRFAYALAETVRLGARMAIDVRILFRGLDSLVQRVRNELLRDALFGGFSDLIFIDDDQAWKPADFFRLLRHDVDCVGAPVRKKTDAAELYNVTAHSQPIPVDPATGLLIVDAVGTGFLRLSRRAMTALWETSEDYRDDAGNSCRWVFDVGPVNGRLVSEDVAMCMKLREAGIPVHVDADISVEHVGTKVWSGDFAGWLSELQARAVA
jgi:hypothetical protein